MDVIGHRGGAALGPENTLATIRAGLQAGADGVEIDVRLSADGVPVLMHDVNVDRTTPGTGRVDSLSIEVLRSLGVPTLSDVLELVPLERRLIVELKGTPWEAGHDMNEPLARVVAETLTQQEVRNVTVSSFNPLALAALRAGAPEVPTGVLTSPAFDLGSNLAAAVDSGNEECHVPAELLDPDFVVAAHDAGRRVLAWTVNDATEVARFAAWGLDGVITDDPGIALRALGR